MEKPKLTLSEHFVLEEVFNNAKNEYPGYYELIVSLKEKVFDAFDKENDIRYIQSFDDMNREMMEDLKRNNDPVLKGIFGNYDFK